MPYKVSEEEKIVELAILKAKEVLMELTGKTVKPKRPNKNPKEEKIKNPVGEEGYGLGGQISKMQEIHKTLNLILKEAGEARGVGLNPNITSNEADPSTKDDYRDVYSKRGMAQVERIGKKMDDLLNQLKSNKITDRQYVSAMMPLLDNMKKYLSYSRTKQPQL